MNDLKVEPQGYTDHPTPIQIHLSQHEGKFLKCSAPDLAPSTGPTFSPSMVGFDAKFHQRIIVKEVGYPLHDEESITTVFKSARDAAEVLEFMSKNELVHRNVSSGNILIVDGKGKLVDLEYAQIIGAGGCHGVRTGTIAFMAVEVAIDEYYFTAEPSVAALDQLFDIQPPSFVYNPLHDIESLWWVLLWVVLCKVPSTTPPDDLDVIRNYPDKVLRAFSHRLGVGQCSMLIKLDSCAFYRKFEEYLTPAIVPYLPHLLRMKLFLAKSYTAAEAAWSAGGDINPAAWLTIHQDVIQEIDKVFTDPKCGDLTLLPLAIALQNAVDSETQEGTG